MRVRRVVLLGVVATFVGCASNTPTTPTTAAATSGSSITGSVAGPALDTSSVVELEGALTAIDAGSRTVTVSNVVVNVPPGTPIRHGDATLQFGDLHVGDRVEIHATKVGTTVTATSVNDETEAPEPPEANNNNNAPDDADHDEPDEHEGPGHDTNEHSGHDGGDHDDHGGSGRH